MLAEPYLIIAYRIWIEGGAYFRNARSNFSLFFYYTPTLYFESYKEYGFTLLANHIHMGFLCVSQRQLTIESIYDSEPSSGGGQQRTVGGDDKSH